MAEGAKERNIVFYAQNSSARQIDKTSKINEIRVMSMRGTTDDHSILAGSFPPDHRAEFCAWGQGAASSDILAGPSTGGAEVPDGLSRIVSNDLFCEV